MSWRTDEPRLIFDLRLDQWPLHRMHQIDLPPVNINADR
jgi:hypothetical protein